MTHPFEDDTAEYLVLVNEHAQHSLWPAALRVPPGWHSAFGPAARQDCLDQVNARWHRLRPAGAADGGAVAGGTAVAGPGTAGADAGAAFPAGGGR